MMLLLSPCKFWGPFIVLNEVKSRPCNVMCRIMVPVFLTAFTFEGPSVQGPNLLAAAAHHGGSPLIRTVDRETQCIRLQK